MSSFKRSVVLALALALLLAPVLVQAQNVATGSIVGLVRGPEGGALPGVTVTARNLDTGLTRASITDANGVFRLDFLPSGNYEIRADLDGFRSQVFSSIKVTLGSEQKLEFQLQLSKVKEEIVVTAEAPIVESTNPNIAASVGDEAIANLPLNGRDFLDFVALTPASIPDSVGRVHIGGMRGIQNSFNIDGANNQSSFFGEERGGTRPPFTFSQAAIKELQVIQSEYSLQFNSSGGVINAITKSGTNELHGEAFWYYRPDSWVGDYADGRTANDFKRNQFGFALGGPLITDRLHYFVSYDGQRLEQPTLRYFRRFPEDRVADWEALTGLDYDKEVGTVRQTNDQDVALLKLDWQASVNNLFTFRWNYSKNEGENLTNRYSTSGWSNNGFEENTFNSMVAMLNSVIGESMANEAILQYSSEDRPRTANVTSIPEVRIGYYDAVFGQNNFLPNYLTEDRFQIVDNFTWFLGNHTLKAGINFDWVSFDDFFFRYGGGQYYYASYYDDDDVRHSAWDAFFGDVLYRYTQAFSDYGGKVKFDTGYYAGYVQDEWQINPNFILTFGIRYDLQDHDDPKETNPLYPDTGQIPDDTDNWAPRVGFAWDVTGDGRQVLRGGIGMFYDTTPTLLDANAMLTNGIRVVRVVLNCKYTEDCPSWPDRIPTLGDLPAATPSIFAYDPNFENPETLRMSLGYEREVITDLALGVDLIYSETEKLERKQDQNIRPIEGASTIDGRTYYTAWYYGVNYPDLGQVMVFRSDARANYRAVVLKFNKRFSHNWALNGSYTWSRSRDQDSNERSVSSSRSGWPEDQYNLGAEWGPSDYDVKHKFVVSGMVLLPYDFTISGIVYIRSGFPYTAMDGRDLNGDGYHRDRATIEVSEGVYRHYGRNTERQPWYHNMDLRVSKIFRFASRYQVEVMLDIFNLFDNENWYTTNTQLVGRDGDIRSNFGKLNHSGNPRQFQLGARFRW